MLAPAKINLDLRITGRRDDGYHLLDSMVAFAEMGDEVEAFSSDQLDLEIDGPFAHELGNKDENLVIKAANILCELAGAKPAISFVLTKNLPVASGIGGGSSNAAAALKLTNEILQLGFNQAQLEQVALQIGADVPVCLDNTVTHMQGIGDNLTPIETNICHPALLVNPGVSVSTAQIFSEFHHKKRKFSMARSLDPNHINWPLMLDHLKLSTNDLQLSACSLNHEIKEVLKALSDLEGSILNRMSGSGATCFALFEDNELCLSAAEKLSKQYKNWWVKATFLH